MKRWLGHTKFHQGQEQKGKENEKKGRTMRVRFPAIHPPSASTLNKHTRCGYRVLGGGYIACRVLGAKHPALRIFERCLAARHIGAEAAAQPAGGGIRNAVPPQHVRAELASQRRGTRRRRSHHARNLRPLRKDVHLVPAQGKVR